MSPGAGTLTRQDLPECPYVGLDNYSEKYSRLFFGRESERQTLIGNLRASRFTVLYAGSGVGKSSLLRAGVVPRLQELADESLDEESPRYIPAICSDWDGDAIRQVAASIAEGVGRFLPKGETFDVGDGELDDVIKRASDRLDATLLVILDQFEEFFRPTRDDAVRAAFAEAIARCVNRPDLYVNFLVSIREDAYASLGNLFKGHIPNVFGNYLHLAPLGVSGAKDAIRKPLAKYGVEIEDELVNAVIQGVTEQRRPGESTSNGASNGAGPYVAAPYLQLVMEKLWKQEAKGGEPPPVLRRDALGDEGTKWIIQRHVDDAMGRLETEHDKDVAAAALSYLAPSDRGKLTLTLGRLAQFTGKGRDELKRVLTVLDDERIVATVADLESYEIFHDVLAPYLVDWRTRHEQKRLDRLRAYARRQRLLKRIAIVAVGVLLGIVGYIEWSNIQTQQDMSDSRRLSTNALGAADPALASLYALEAYRVSPTPSARAAVLTLADNHQLGAPLVTKTGGFTSVAFTRDGKTLAAGRDDNTVRVWDVATRRTLAIRSGPTERVNSVAYSRDGTLAAGANDGVVRYWDRTGLHKFLPHRGPVGGVAFSDDGKKLAAGYMGQLDASGSFTKGSVQLFNPTDPAKRPITLRGPTGPVASVAVNPRLPLLASSSCEPRLHLETKDHAVRLWDLRTGRQVAILRGHTAPVCSVAFSPDGSLLASASDDHTVLVWDVKRRRTVGMPLVGHTDVVNGVSFSKDGRTIASSSRDHTVRLWDAKQHLQVSAPLANHTSGVPGVAFNPAGGTLASASSDSSVRFWSAASPRELGVIRGASPHWVLSVAFSPRGDKLAWFGDDVPGKTVHRLYVRDLTNGSTTPKVTKTGSINGLAFSPDGKSVAWAASEDQTIRLWDLAQPQPTVIFRGAKTDVIKALAFSRDGKIAFGVTHEPSGISTIELWDTAQHKLVGGLTGSKSEIHGIAFSRDGTRLVSGGDDLMLHLWDVKKLKQIGRPFSAHTGMVLGVAYSPDGKTLASGGSDQMVRLWSVETHRQVGPPLSSHIAAVYSVAFSPDGKTLVSGSADDTVRLWDVPQRSSLGAPLSGHTGQVFGVAFSPDGRKIASGSADGTVRLWNNYSLETATNRLCGYVDKQKAERTWKIYEPSIDYRKPC